MPMWARATRASSPSTASSSIASRSWRPAACPSWRRRRTCTADVDAILAKVTAEDQDRLPRQSQQPDRHLPALRRGQAPARGPAAACAAGARCGLCGICPPQRLRVGPRTRRDRRERRDDAHLLEDLRPRQPAPRLDGRRRPMSSTRSTASAAPSTSAAPAMAAGIAAIADEAHVAKAVAHNEQWLAWLTREIEALGPRGDAERRQFPARPFPADARADGEGRRRVPLRRAG